MGGLGICTSTAVMTNRCIAGSVRRGVRVGERARRPVDRAVGRVRGRRMPTGVRPRRSWGDAPLPLRRLWQSGACRPAPRPSMTMRPGAAVWPSEFSHGVHHPFNERNHGMLTVGPDGGCRTCDHRPSTERTFTVARRPDDHQSRGCRRPTRRVRDGGVASPCCSCTAGGSITVRTSDRCGASPPAAVG